jgi:uncharacterized GH25 family protein
MTRKIGAVLVGLVAAAAAHAHFPFIVPDETGQSAKVVLSDTLAPDPDVNIEKIGNTKLTLRDSAGKESALDWKKIDGFYAVNVPGSGDRLVYGATDFGVLQKGDSKPFWLMYYPKAAFGNASAKPAGGKVALEVVAEGGAGGKVRFQVLAMGKPLPESEVTVLVPGGAKKAQKTDKDGYTAGFEGAGRYGVYAKRVEATAGEHAGKKFNEIRSYATLVCDVAK